MPLFPEKLLKRWFTQEKRDFPWRDEPDPYKVWVSEVMLQQTRASVVIPYYHRWMGAFPNLTSLAKAPLETVIKLWEGLGYYSRARNLHRGAQYLLSEHNGNFPTTYDELVRIPGIGPYTAGAIMSFAFKKKGAALDGNVIRVLSRFFFIEDAVDLPKTQKKLRSLLLSLLPDEDPHIVMEGLIELGALICTKSPKCLLCPLKTQCRAFADATAALLPNKQRKQQSIALFRHVFLIYVDDHILLQRGKSGRVMADLYEFPYLDAKPDSCPKALVQKWWGEPLLYETSLAVQTHTFTRYRATLSPTIWKSERQKNIPEYHWHPIDQIDALPFSSGHKRILQDWKVQR